MEEDKKKEDKITDREPEISLDEGDIIIDEEEGDSFIAISYFFTQQVLCRVSLHI